MRYVGTLSLTMTEEERLARIIDEAPRPYTVAEIASLSGLPTERIRGWLVKNQHCGYVSSRQRGRLTAGKPVAEYWRGDRSVGDTFGGTANLVMMHHRVVRGERPVSWTDRTRTVYSIDPAGILAVQKGNYTAPIGPVADIEDTGTGVRIAIEGGPVLTFGGSDRWHGRSVPTASSAHTTRTGSPSAPSAAARTRRITMQVKSVSITRIKPYEKNPRINDNAVDAVAASIEQFGFQQPIVVDRDNVIIVGHTRYKAAKKLGLKEVPVVRAEDLTEEQVRAYRIADNSTNTLASWDFDLLADELADISIDMGEFGILLNDYGAVDYNNLEERMGERSEEYEAFLDKFREKHTTDDCFTPPAVYDALLSWVKRTYDLGDRPIVRPFYPGGDYQNFDYPEGCVVVDNPPFSILMQIAKFYHAANIDFFLFADTRTIGWYSENFNLVLTNSSVTYENGAIVNTGFITNMGTDKVTVSAELYELIDEAQPKDTADLNAYAYPDNLTNAPILSKLAKYGINLKITNTGFIKKTDCGNEIYGGGILMSDAMAEKVKAEKVKAEKVKAEKVKIPLSLSPREREIIDRLNELDAIP